MFAAGLMLAAFAARAQEPKAGSAVPSWVEKITLKGDFRYRFDYVDDETEDEPRQRDRRHARAVTRP
jgi:hypothetical protein